MGASQAVLEAAAGYLKRHPEELGRLFRNALGLRVGVPVSSLQWLARQGGGGPQDLEIESVPPGLRMAATMELMGTMVRASSIVYVDRVVISDREAKVELRLEETDMKVLDQAAETPVAALIRSGALDLTKTGSLAAHMPNIQALLRESRGNRVIIDLMNHPAFSDSRMARRLIGLLSSFMTVHEIETDGGHVDMGFRAFPRGVRGAFSAVREHVLAPARPWIRGVLNPGR